jgi:hypothetical protein
MIGTRQTNPGQSMMKATMPWPLRRVEPNDIISSPGDESGPMGVVIAGCELHPVPLVRLRRCPIPLVRMSRRPVPLVRRMRRHPVPLVRMRRIPEITTALRRGWIALAVQMRRRRATIALLHDRLRRIGRPGCAGSAVILHGRRVSVPCLGRRRALGVGRRRGLVGAAGPGPNGALSIGGRRHGAAGSVASDVRTKRPADGSRRVAARVAAEAAGVV